MNKREFNNIFIDTLSNSLVKAVKPTTSDSYIPDTKDYRIANIKDIKQNGPATIIFLKNGEKVVVKCQDDINMNALGLIVCLIKYISPTNKIYSDCIESIFIHTNYVFDKDILKEAVKRAEIILISHIGKEELLKISHKFFGVKKEN